MDQCSNSLHSLVLKVVILASMLIYNLLIIYEIKKVYNPMKTAHSLGHFLSVKSMFPGQLS